MHCFSVDTGKFILYCERLFLNTIMVIKEQKEIKQLIADSSRILITTRGNPGFDDVATCLAWYESMRKLKKDRVDVVMQLEDETKNRFKFLPGFKDIQDSIKAADFFVIQIGPTN